MERLFAQEKMNTTSQQTIWHWWCFSLDLNETTAYNGNSYNNIYDIGLFTNNFKRIDLEDIVPIRDNESALHYIFPTSFSII